MYQSVCAVFAVILVGALAQVPHMCPLPEYPCRLQVTYRNDTEYSDMTTQTCTCNTGSCSDNWNLRSHVIRRKLITINQQKRIILKMMFCDRIEPQATCATGQEALELEGPSEMPLRVIRHPCKCPQNKPLVLYRTSVGENHLTNHIYVCGMHKPTCPPQASHRCMTLRESTSAYHCKCRQRKSCLPDSTVDPLTGLIYGHCHWPGYILISGYPVSDIRFQITDCELDMPDDRFTYLLVHGVLHSLLTV